MPPSPSFTIRGARLWDGAKSCESSDVTVSDGRFGALSTASTSVGSTAENDIDARGLWLVPGFVDAHAHVAWNDFDESDRDAHTAEERDAAARRTLRVMRAAGVTGARDAGGADRSIRALHDQQALGPRLQISVELLDRDRVDAMGGIGPAVDAMLEAGADWIKLVATGGVASPAGSQLISHFTASEFALAVHLAAEAGARVMVHAWGGEAVTHALDAGVASIEHGIFLTPDQARLGAERAAVLVPTLHIYRLVQAMIAAGSLPAAFGARVAEAVEAHPAAVRRARDAGMAIAMGSDFSTPEQHGTNLREIAELRRAGLDADEALVAATRTGARLLAGGSRDAGAAEALDLAGRISPGAVADAVLLRADPSLADTFWDPDVVVGVIQDGRLLSRHPLSDAAAPDDSPAPLLRTTRPHSDPERSIP